MSLTNICKRCEVTVTNTRLGRYGSIVSTSFAVVLMTSVLACAPAGTSLRAISDSTATPVASAPIAPPAPAVQSGPAVGAPVNAAVPAPAAGQSVASVAAQPVPVVQTTAPSSVRGIAVSGT